MGRPAASGHLLLCRGVRRYDVGETRQKQEAGLVQVCVPAAQSQPGCGGAWYSSVPHSEGRPSEFPFSLLRFLFSLEVKGSSSSSEVILLGEVV